MEERICLGLPFQRVRVHDGRDSVAAGGRHGSGSSKLRAHPLTHKQREEKGLRIAQVLKLSKPAPSDHFLQPDHTSDLPQTVPSTGE